MRPLTNKTPLALRRPESAICGPNNLHKTGAVLAWLDRKGKHNMQTKTSNQPLNHSPLRSASTLFTCLSIVAAVALCATGHLARAQLPDVTADYSIEVVQPPADASIVIFLWLNNSGMTSIEYLDTGFQLRAALLQNGTWKSIAVPNSVQTGTSNPNSSGGMALIYSDNAGNWHNALYHKGTYSYLPDYYAPPAQPPYSFTVMLLNDSGIMTGVAYDTHGVGHGLLLNQSLSLFRIFDFPGALSTTPYGLNNAGDIVGTYIAADGTQHAFLSRQGLTFSNVDPPGALFPAAIGINNQGELCGFYVDSTSGVFQGFLLREGVFSVLKLPDAAGSGPNWINDEGTLAGSFVDAAGNQYGYIARPIRGR